jgi:RNA polymerase sigma-70 factor (ECF subfamily)
MKEDVNIINYEDAVLIASWRKGKLSSFDALVLKYQKRMLNIAFRITGDYEDAREVTQDAFVAAYQKIESFRGESLFYVWLTSITVNLSRNRLLQGQTKRKNEAYSLDCPWPDDEESASRDHPSPSPSALERLERLDLHEKLLECIKGLTDEFREAIVLKDMQDFSYDEICDILKIRIGTVKSRLSRAREFVKDCVKRSVGEL